MDSSEPLHAALRALGERASAALERGDEIRAWRSWALSLRDVFEVADRVWVALDAALDAAHVTASRVLPPTDPSMIVGLGIDAVDIARVERMFADKPERMLERLFGETERAYLATKPQPAQHMAVRLAAKEAAYKALCGERARARDRLARRRGRDAATTGRPSSASTAARRSGSPSWGRRRSTCR